MGGGHGNQLGQGNYDLIKGRSIHGITTIYYILHVWTLGYTPRFDMYSQLGIIKLMGVRARLYMGPKHPSFSGKLLFFLRLLYVCSFRYSG